MALSSQLQMSLHVFCALFCSIYVWGCGRERELAQVPSEVFARKGPFVRSFALLKLFPSQFSDLTASCHQRYHDRLLIWSAFLSSVFFGSAAHQVGNRREPSNVSRYEESVGDSSAASPSRQFLANRCFKGVRIMTGQRKKISECGRWMDGNN